MNIDKLVSNLEQTIAGKKLLHDSLTQPIIKNIIQMNIDELQRILNDALIIQQQFQEMKYDLEWMHMIHGGL